MKIKNWARFQHYKDRSPPWIKLYRDLLNDREWFALDDQSARLLVNLWLIAAESDGHIPAPLDIAFRLRMKGEDVVLGLSKLSHWLEQDASNVLADCQQVATPETERETERKNSVRAAKPPPDSQLSLVPLAPLSQTNNAPPPAAAPRPPSREADYFRRGREVLGEKSGGLISKLLRHHNGNIEAAWGVIENAADCDQPREYVGAALRKTSNGGWQ